MEKHPQEIASEQFLSGGGEMGERIRAKDWSKTPLGDARYWPQSLKTCVRIVLTSRQPMFVWWGKELINIYNDAYKAIVGGKHPRALGQPASEVWREIWTSIGPRAETVMTKNVGTYDEALLLIMERNGYPEETYYTFSYSPVPGDHGGTDGIICANTDDTQRIISSRQLRTLTELGKCIIDCKTNAEVFSNTIDVLKGNPQDFPFAFLYEITKDGAGAMLVGSVSAVGEDVAPSYVNLQTGEHDPWQLKDLVQPGKISVVSNLEARLGRLPSGAWQQPPDKALLVPISRSGQQQPFVVLVVGSNPFSQPTGDYQSFFQLVADQVAMSLANIYTYEEERRRAEALAEIDKAKTAFFSNVSHEFRTPLTLMLGPLEALMHAGDDQVAPVHKTSIESTHRNAMRLLRLVNTLLDFSRIEADRVQASYHPVDLAHFTNDLASGFRSIIENAGLRYEVDCAELAEKVYVDREMWEKIVFNLLSNAFKYTLRGSIKVRLSQENDWALFSVSDTGVGIPEQELPRMFERFHRVQYATGRTHEGTGIGLSLVKELVNIHRGRISVSSRQGEGSVFTVAIPVGRDHLPPTHITERDDAPYESLLSRLYVKEAISLTRNDMAGNGELHADEDNEAPATAKPAILVVDDNADMRDYIKRLLEKNYRVETAIHGRQALEKLAGQPDLVITDVMMPVMDGIELLHAIKSKPATASLPVILLSARAGEESKIAGYESGADDYLIKPFSARELLARVRSQIKMAQNRVLVERQLEQKVEERTRELKQANNELAKSNHELEQFAYIASHDLQEPLRKIQIFSELLQKNLNDGAATLKYIDKINSSATRMTVLIRDVLNYSRLSQMNAGFETIDLNVVLQNVLTDFELLIADKHAVIKYGTLPVVKGIALQYHQLFSNLISNSLKFSDKDPLIQVSSGRLQPGEIKDIAGINPALSYTCLRFEDNGIGFEQQYAEQIFTIFQRLNTRQFGGTGIGLALCKKIVENHHGVIVAEGRPGAGAVFTIYLPV